jgi:hypothetical protein
MALDCKEERTLLPRRSHAENSKFIIEGVVTVVAGLVAPLLLIEFPERAKFLNDRKKHIARERILCEL